MKIAAPAAAAGLVPRVRRAAPRGALPPPKAPCPACQLRELFLTCDLDADERERLDSLKFARRRVKDGQALFREGDPFQFIYAVCSGTFKSHLTLRDCRDQVTGFQMSGDLLGVDGLASGRHASTAIALEDAEICAIPYAQLSELASDSPRLHGVISRLMSREIVREHRLMVMLLGSMNAEERLAAFLLNISQRMQARGYSASEFHLRMSRAEIGSYLGIQLETVSRAFTAFAQQRLLDVQRKHVRIMDLDALQQALG